MAFLWGRLFGIIALEESEHIWSRPVNLSISTRLGLGFGVLILLILGFGSFVLHQMSELEKQSRILLQHPFTVVRALDTVAVNIVKIHREMKDLANVVQPDQVRFHLSRVDAYEKEALQQLELVRSKFLGDKIEVEQVHQALMDWRPIREDVVRLRLAGDRTAADVVTRGVGARHTVLLESELLDLRRFAGTKADETLVNVESVTSESREIIGAVLVLAAFLGVAIAVPIARSIRNPLVRLDHAVARVSEGDMEQQVAVQSRDELGRLSLAFNSMVTRIRENTQEIQRKSEENERLLLNILPAPVAQRLKRESGVIAEHFEHVSVLFADIVGFAKLSQELTANEMVEWLNEVYSAFDAFVVSRGVEKIRTIGDNYMVASGVPFAREDHAVAITDLALDMIGFIETMRPVGDHTLSFRVGINSGSAVGGVIGTHKFQYDIWGDSVNTAARMESHGQPGRIHVSHETYLLIKDAFECEPRGGIAVKSKGLMETWFVCGRR